MNMCRRVQELIPLYVLGECNEAELVEVKEHLRRCEVCKEYLRDVSTLYKSFEEREEITVPDIGAEIVYSVNQRIDKFERKRRIFSLLTPAFAVVFIALVVSLFFLRDFSGGFSSPDYDVEFIESVGFLGDVADEAVYEDFASTGFVAFDDLLNEEKLKREFLLYEFQGSEELDLSSVFSAMDEKEFEKFVDMLYASSL